MENKSLYYITKRIAKGDRYYSNNWNRMSFSNYYRAFKSPFQSKTEIGFDSFNMKFYLDLAKPDICKFNTSLINYYHLLDKYGKTKIKRKSEGIIFSVFHQEDLDKAKEDCLWFAVTKLNSLRAAKIYEEDYTPVDESKIKVLASLINNSRLCIAMTDISPKDNFLEKYLWAKKAIDLDKNKNSLINMYNLLTTDGSASRFVSTIEINDYKKEIYNLTDFDDVDKNIKEFNKKVLNDKKEMFLETKDESLFESISFIKNYYDTKSIYEIAIKFIEKSSHDNSDSLKNGLDLLEYSADKGCYNSCSELAEIYYYGRHGIKPDNVIALNYYRKKYRCRS